MKQTSSDAVTPLWSQTREYTCGAITASAPGHSGESDPQSDREAIAFLQSRGYSLTKVSASYLEDAGHEAAAYFVCNKHQGDDQGRLEADLRTLGLHLGRDAILSIPCGGIGAVLLGTTQRTDAPLPWGEKRPVEDPSHTAAGRFIKMLRDPDSPGELVPSPQTYHGKWAQHVLAQELVQRWQTDEADSRPLEKDTSAERLESR